MCLLGGIWPMLTNECGLKNITEKIGQLELDQGYQNCS